MSSSNKDPSEAAAVPSKPEGEVTTDRAKQRVGGGGGSVYVAELDRISSQESLLSVGSMDSYDQPEYEVPDFAMMYLGTNTTTTTTTSPISSPKNNSNKSGNKATVRMPLPPFKPVKPVTASGNKTGNSSASPRSRQQPQSQAPRSARSTQSQASIKSTGFKVEKTTGGVIRTLSQDSMLSLASLSLRLAPKGGGGRGGKQPGQGNSAASLERSTKSFDLYGTPVYHSSNDTSSLSGVHDDSFFVRLLPTPLQWSDPCLQGNGNGGRVVESNALVGALILAQLATGSLAVLPVHYDRTSHHLGVSTSFATLAQVGLRPANGTNPQEQTIADMAFFSRQTLLMRFSVFSSPLARHLRLHRYPYSIVSPERAVHFTSHTVRPPTIGLTTGVSPTTAVAASNPSGSSSMYSSSRLAHPGQPSTLPIPSLSLKSTNAKSKQVDQPSKSSPSDSPK